MDTCSVCKQEAKDDRVIACSGTCGQVFHQGCAGINKTHFGSWTARVGLFWFCESCRLNFNPAAYDRDKLIMKALRELLIRMDSMDTRLGNYGENLRKINKTLYVTPVKKSSKPLLEQSAFVNDINQLSLNDSADDPINRSRSCDETSFFEILDDINSTVSHQSDKFIVGAGKRVQILQGLEQKSVSSTANNKQPGTSNQPNALGKQTGNSNQPTRKTTPPNDTNIEQTSDRGLRIEKPRMDLLKVALPAAVEPDSQATFYISPFVPSQSEEEVKKHICDITNADPSTVQVVRLVARGKTNLTYVSFKASVPKEAATVVGDQWYWPDGVRVRPFELRSKNEPVTLQQ